MQRRLGAGCTQERQRGGLDRNDQCACSAVALINCSCVFGLYCVPRRDFKCEGALKLAYMTGFGHGVAVFESNSHTFTAILTVIYLINKTGKC